MRFAVTHETIHRFSEPATRAIHTLRLTPRNTEGQLVQSWRIDVSHDCRLSPVEDAWGNPTHTFSIDGPIDELSIVASGRIVTTDTTGVLGPLRDRVPLAVYRRSTELTDGGPELCAFARDTVAAVAGDRLASLHALMAALHERVAVDPEAPERRPAAAFAQKAATVDDLAHLFLAAARAIEVPARFVSGLLWRSAGTAETGGHAWIEAHLGALGWVGFDAAENRCPTEPWIRLSVGLDALGAAAHRGVHTHHGSETIETRITVEEIGAV
jgi:transglutaminase-like putative cysteine protease